jgi:hypothetical protein
VIGGRSLVSVTSDGSLRLPVRGRSSGLLRRGCDGRVASDPLISLRAIVMVVSRRHGVLVAVALRLKLMRICARLRTVCPSGSSAVQDVWLCAIRCVCAAAFLFIASPRTAAASSWALQSVPASQSSGGLGAVSCTSDTACVTVGAIAARWNGRHWSKLPDTSAGGGLSCTSSRACIAVGGSGTPLAARWNGREWSRQRVPHKVGVTTGLEAVSCTSGSACTAVGYSGIGPTQPHTVFVERFDGRRWSVQTAPTPQWAVNTFLNSVSCVSQTLCIAVGMGDTYDQLTRPLAERWNGRRWAIEHTPRRAGSISAVLNSVSCSSSNACTAVGEADDATFVERWSGGRWRIQPSPR